jgi:AcrR family transcriptional regulator
MGTVAREAGASKALLHYYFSTRSQLVRAAFAYSEQRAWARAEAELALPASGIERLERFLLLDLDDNPVYRENRVLWSEACGNVRRDEELRPLVEGSYRAWIERLTEIIDEGRSDGSVEFDTDAAELAWRLGAVVDGAESMTLLGLIDDEHARALVRDSLARELQTPALHAYDKGER